MTLAVTADLAVTQRPSRPAAFLAACQGEWIKFRSLHSNRVALIGAAVLTLAIGALLAMATSSHFHHGLVSGRVWDPTSVSLMGIGVMQLALAVLGVMMVSAEYPTGLIWVTLSAVPHRGRLLAAKTAVLALVGLVVGEVTSFVTFAAGQAVISGSAPTASLASPAVLRAVAGTGLFLAVIGILGVAVGALTRSTTGGVAVIVAIMFVLPGVEQVLPTSWRDPMLKFWPTQAGGQMLNVAHQAHALGPWAGLGLLAVFTAVLGLAATIRFVRTNN
jgi:ABC-2 type transport system permease protein